MSSPLEQLAVEIISDEERGYLVKDYWNQAGVWKYDRLRGKLPQECINQLHATVLDEDSNNPDMISSALEPNMEFSTQSAYESETQELVGQRELTRLRKESGN